VRKEPYQAARVRARWKAAARRTVRETLRRRSPSAQWFDRSAQSFPAGAVPLTRHLQTRLRRVARLVPGEPAIEMLAKNLVIELSPYGITINSIAPGATLTERTLHDKEYKSTWERITPLGKVAEINDIVTAALFFVSPASRHITGQSLVIDGGWTSVSPSPF